MCLGLHITVKKNKNKTEQKQETYEEKKRGWLLCHFRIC